MQSLPLGYQLWEFAHATVAFHPAFGGAPGYGRMPQFPFPSLPLAPAAVRKNWLKNSCSCAAAQTQTRQLRLLMSTKQTYLH